MIGESRRTRGASGGGGGGRFIEYPIFLFGATVKPKTSILRQSRGFVVFLSAPLPFVLHRFRCISVGAFAFCFAWISLFVEDVAIGVGPT